MNKYRRKKHLGLLMQMLLFSILFSSARISVLAAQSEDIIHEIEFSQSDLNITAEEGYDIIKTNWHASTREAGKPQVPYKVYQFAVANDIEVTGIEILEDVTEKLEGEFLLYPAQESQHYGSQYSFTNPDKDAYASQELYPAEMIKKVKSGNLSDVNIVTVHVYPIQYLPAQKELILHKKIKFKLSSEERTGKNTAASSSKDIKHRKRKTISDKSDKALKDAFKKVFTNSEAVDTTLQDSRSAVEAELSGEILLAGSYSGTVDYIIITSQALITSQVFQPLLDEKTNQGLTAEIESVEWIEQNVSGRDTAEKIRNFIIDLYTNNGLVWVLLGGDVNIVPVRPAYVASSYIPTDMYYSDLDGDWDADQDSIFGEYEDNLDLYPDVFVGRAPVEDQQEAQVFVSKILTYIQGQNPDFYNTALFLGCEDFQDAGGQTKDYIDAQYMPQQFDPITKLYERDLYAYSAQAITEINSGHHIINHIDHADIDRMYTGSDYITTQDVDSFSNAPDYSVLWSVGCYFAAIDTDTIAEHWLNNPDGGAVALAGNSRYGWHPESDTYLDPSFFETIVVDEINRIGQTLAMSKVPFIGQTVSNEYMKYAILELNLLGDPEMTISGLQVIPETPWQTNENGTLRTNIRWNYTMGYRFVPEVDGEITQLGGFFNGTKTVYLWDSSQNLLASAAVTASNEWSFVDLPTPVPVTQGETYTVAAYMAGSGASYRYGIDYFPQTYDNISIQSTCYRYGNGYPTANSISRMYGQVDIGFLADSGTSANCGDGICQADEGYDICPQDCPIPTCGNGVCEWNDDPMDPIYEDAYTCLPDCAETCNVPDPELGVPICEVTEGFESCQHDCPSPYCGNGTCEWNDDPMNPIYEDGYTCRPDCAVTCNVPDPELGVPICEVTEGFESCQHDCPSPYCGNGTCEWNDDPMNPIYEDGYTCRPDCAVTCNVPDPELGVPICEVTEGFESCQHDCPSPYCGNGTCEWNDDPMNPIYEDGYTCRPDCAVTCNVPDPELGVPICEETEGFESCQHDCPSPYCGNGICEWNDDPMNPIYEDGYTCRPDCAVTCNVPDPELGVPICEETEGFESCQHDCPSPYCGNGTCEWNDDPMNPIYEDGYTCRPDCAVTCNVPDPELGVPICEVTEGFESCQHDCPSPYCGNGTCEWNDDPMNPIYEDGYTCRPDCAVTCNVPDPELGVPICEETEGFESCQHDCPSPYCGNGTCEWNDDPMNPIYEDGYTCRPDCTETCNVPDPTYGVPICEVAEIHQTCQHDCPSPYCGNSVCETEYGEDCMSCAYDCGPC